MCREIQFHMKIILYVQKTIVLKSLLLFWAKKNYNAACLRFIIQQLYYRNNRNNSTLNSTGLKKQTT